ARFVGELPKEFRLTADADLYGAFGVEHALEHSVPEWAAVVELVAFELSTGVAVGVDVNEAHRPLASDRTQDRQRNRVIAPHGKRHDAGIDQRRNEGFDVAMAGQQVVTAFERHVTHVGKPAQLGRRHAQGVFVQAHALYEAHRARAQSRPCAIGHAQVHGYAQQGDVDWFGTRFIEYVGPVRRIQKGRHARVGRGDE